MPRPSVASLWIAGAAILLVGVVGLERVFLNERRDALEALASENAALSGYAVADLEERFRGELASQTHRIESALSDPLADAEGLLYVRGGRQRLPRSFSFLDAGTEPRAEALHARLKAGELSEEELEGEDPWSSRLRLLATFRRGLSRSDRDTIESSFRRILTERARFVIDSRDDLTFMVALLELLSEQSEAGAEADPGLMRMMLLDGVTDSRGNRITGLQTQLLERREKLTEPDFEFLGRRIAALSERSGVRHDAFAARLAEPSAARIALPEKVRSPLLVESGAWLVAPAEEGAVAGVAVDLEALLGEVREAMHARGLLTFEDRLTLAAPASPTQPLSATRVAVESPRWDRRRAAIERRFWLKTGLAVFIVTLVAGAFGVREAWTRRERQLLALKSGFVATVSHELRTPLASMRLMAETLERRLAGVESVRDYPERLVREIDSLTFLVENLLSFNRLEKGKWVPRIEPVPLSEIVHTLERELPSTTTKGIRVRFEGASELTVKVDPELARLLFLNLGTNAVKYNESETVEILVEARPGRPTVVRVADNGIGIPRERHDDVFQEFQRLETTGRGFGLGLAICRRIMELHEGVIRVADSSSKGTVFELSFP